MSKQHLKMVKTIKRMLEDPMLFSKLLLGMALWSYHRPPFYLRPYNLREAQ